MLHIQIQFSRSLYIHSRLVYGLFLVQSAFWSGKHYARRFEDGGENGSWRILEHIGATSIYRLPTYPFLAMAKHLILTPHSKA